MIGEHAWLAVRSVLWAALLPGLVAGYVPWRFLGLREASPDLRNAPDLLALLSMRTGAALLGACVREFARSGRGTLSPADPPRTLVIRGLYRYVRNPMYLSVTLIVLGEALLARSLPLFAYWAAWFAGVNVFVIAYEEPALRRSFGAEYDEYARRVGRWVPSVRAGASHPLRPGEADTAS